MSLTAKEARKISIENHIEERIKKQIFEGIKHNATLGNYFYNHSGDITLYTIRCFESLGYKVTSNNSVQPKSTKFEW